MRVVAAVLLCLILCALPAQAQTGADAQIEIFPPDGRPPVTLIYSQLGEPDRPGAYSLANVLRRAGVPVGTYDRVEVTQAGGAVVAIQRGEVRLTETRTVPTERIDDPTATLAERYKDEEFDRANPVVLRTNDAGAVELLRPRAPLAQNPDDTVLLPVDGRFTIRVVADARLQSSRRTARPGDAVTFTATPPAGTVYEGVQYEWDFDDGQIHSGTEREVTHIYAKGGTVAATVRFLRDGRELGHASVTVYVADPSEQGSGNVDPDDRRARRRDVTKADTGGDGNAGEGEGGSGPGGSGTPSAGTPANDWVPPPVDSAPPPADTAVTPPSVETPPLPPEPEFRPEPRRTAPEPEPVGETVDGYLLASASGPGGGADAELPADAPQELQELARRPTEAATNGRTLPTVAWVGVGVLALLVLGWALEGRRTLPYWQP